MNPPSRPTARAVVFPAPGKVELRDFVLPEPAPGHVIVRSDFTCISPGTELRRLSGREMVGASAFPIVPGYCLAGRVVERGPGVDLPLGAPVVTFGSSFAGGLNLGEGGHVSHALLPADRTIPVPPGVDLLDASACVLAGIAWHGLRRASVGPADRVAVIGLGAIGQMAARVCAALGAEVAGFDKIAARVAALSAVGLRAASAAPTLPDAAAPFFPKGVDVIVDCTGSARAIADALRLARPCEWDPRRDMPGARYLVLGSPVEDLRVPYAAAYGCQCAILFSSGSQFPDCAAALDLVARRRLSVRNAITDVRPPDAAPATYRELSQTPGALITVAFDWR